MDKFFLTLLVSMVITGTINTLSIKWADQQSSKGSNGKVRPFEHPFFEAVCMFVGEMLCMVAFQISILNAKRQGQEIKKAEINPLLFAIPALCDMTATSTSYIGLGWTYASIFQMLRGSTVIYTGIFSVLFLKQKLKAYHWTGMLCVLLGLSCVGISSVLFPDNSASAKHPLAGAIIIVCAQLIVATQMVVEEKLLSKYSPAALQVVGWEGIFGFIGMSIVLTLLYFIPGGRHIDDAYDAFVQIKNSKFLVVALLGNVFSIAFFNYFGVSITKYSSATTRVVLDCIRTVLIWGITLALGWQEFTLKSQSIQFVGFLMLLFGTMLYNGVVVLRFLGPNFTPDKKQTVAEETPLLNEKDPYVQ